MVVMLNILVGWLIIGIIVAYFKVRQSRQYGFDRRLNFGTISYFAIGVVIWPLIVFYIYKEKKTHEEAHIQAQVIGKSAISSLTSDLKPDSWVTFYLFYFNQGLGSDTSFQLGNRLVHIFVGNLMTAENNEAIIEAVDKKHELAVGEFMHILTQLSNYDLGQFKSSAGVSLVVENQSGKAESTFFKNKEDIKAFVMNLRSQGAQQLH